MYITIWCTLADKSFLCFSANTLCVCVCMCDAVGDTDGLFKGKRYFTCPPKHGKVLRITNVIAVLPNKVSLSQI